MKLWEDIINKATLGSGKLPLKSSDIPEIITQKYEVFDSQDPEEDFLRFSSLIYQYRRAGSLPLNFQHIAHAEAELEIKSYCSPKASGVLNTILEEDLMPFLKLWIKQCASKELIVTPELIPALLDIALRKKEFRKLIRDISGKRGEWLCKLNLRWNFNSSSTDQHAVWETGNSEERKELLRDLRTNNPGEALELLKTTWATEGANEKLTYLEILRINLSQSDLSWLESLKEKGQKVNAAVLDLMKSIPTSSIVAEYSNVLKNAINIKKGKALLGMVNKTNLDVSDNLTIPDIVFKSGVEKLSSDKNVSDNQYILAQLISAVPPSFWNDHLQLSAEAIIELFQKEKKTAFYIPALAIASIKFKDINWSKSILDHADPTIIDSSVAPMINSLSGKDRDGYARKFLKEKPREIIQVMIDQEEEWSLDLAKLIIHYTSNEIYNYNRSFYRPAAPLIPVAILEILESFTPTEEQKKVYWKNQSDELARLLTIKQQTLQSFTA
ncbi:DUF5691 domain-containing protein [Chryseolinea sp. H1M3-3]|uniref:DUF5691 domain-containing protein n=1 Tax=Chryseolinea sp. H1M3-3 TaxID=3034144 RepID=UPI0023EE14C3|nr:DUF5691 domain-containing protein [Chryseolinea sp. H1M3-3]